MRGPLVVGQHLGNLAAFVDILFILEFGQAGVGAFARRRTLDELQQRLHLRAQVEVVKESVLLMAYVDKGGIQAGDQLLDTAEIDVADRKSLVFLFAVELDQRFVFQQSDGHLLCVGVDNQFTVQCIFFFQLPADRQGKKERENDVVHAAVADRTTHRLSRW